MTYAVKSINQFCHDNYMFLRCADGICCQPADIYTLCLGQASGSLLQVSYTGVLTAVFYSLRRGFRCDNGYVYVPAQDKQASIQSHKLGVIACHIIGCNSLDMVFSQIIDLSTI